MLRHCVSALALAALSSAATGAEQTFDVRIAEQQIVGGASTHTVSEGDDVELRWHADEDVELHLHGYEVTVRVPAGGSASMAFTAEVTGRFPISHHGFGQDAGREHGVTPILYLEVHPE